ncbi:MAG: TetR/AcrR family transcriptional regulator [Candidatus Hydrogenedentota bacterium]|nr:MAG: TetR/AcrR family transcriptional regulator [Candidatus Hydrogenedentota bacterium]
MSSKQKILVNAANLMHTKGFNSTSIQDILDASSVTKSNFYYHFGSKEQLGFEVLKQRMRQFHAFAMEPSMDNQELGPMERVDAFLDRVLSIGALPEGELGCPFGNLAQEMSAIHEPFRQSLSEFFRTGAERLEQCFEEGKRIGAFRKDLPSRRLAEFALAQVQGSFLLRKTHKDFRIMKSNIDMLREVIKGWA